MAAHPDTLKNVESLLTLETPCLVLDADRMARNVARLRGRLAPLGVRLRPHLKTGKSVEVARRVMDSPTGPATVSTLKEASQFAAAGVRDMIYAVGIAPAKLGRVLELRAAGVDLAVVLDTVEQAEAAVGVEALLEHHGRAVRPEHQDAAEEPQHAEERHAEQQPVAGVRLEAHAAVPRLAPFVRPCGGASQRGLARYAGHGLGCPRARCQGDFPAFAGHGDRAGAPPLARSA